MLDARAHISRSRARLRQKANTTRSHRHRNSISLLDFVFFQKFTTPIIPIKPPTNTPNSILPVPAIQSVSTSISTHQAGQWTTTCRATYQSLLLTRTRARTNRSPRSTTTTTTKNPTASTTTFRTADGPWRFSSRCSQWPSAARFNSASTLDQSTFRARTSGTGSAPSRNCATTSKMAAFVRRRKQSANFIDESWHLVGKMYDLTVFRPLAVSIFAIGGMIGGLSVGTVADLLGRKKALLYNNAFAAIGGSLLTGARFVNSYPMLVAGRFVIGLNCGWNSGLAPTYLTEISPSNLSGTIGSFAQLFITIAILFSQVVGSPFLLGAKDRWQYIFAFTFLPIVVQLCVLPMCPESPKFNLVIRQRRNEAESDLKKLRGEDDVSMEMKRMDKEADFARSQPKVRLADMFGPQLRWPLALAVFMMVSQQLSGINAVMFYSADIFKSAGIDKDQVYLPTIGVGAINVLMTVVSVYLVDRVGRRTLHIGGMVGMLITTGIIPITIRFGNVARDTCTEPGIATTMASTATNGLSYVMIALVFLFVISFASGPGSIPWFFVMEVFPFNARGHANSFVVLTNWALTFVVGIGFTYVQSLFEEWSFLIFTAMLALFIVFAVIFIPETKDKTLEQIQKEIGVAGQEDDKDDNQA